MSSCRPRFYFTAKQKHMRVSALVSVFFTSLFLAGCANSIPWMNSQQAALEKEKYGLNADQRIKELSQQAKKVKGGNSEARAGFSKKLVNEMMAEHDPRVRAEILKCTAGFDNPSARAICVGGLDDPDSLVRIAACDAWVEIGGDEAIRHLANRFRSDEDIDVRLHAVRDLGSLGNEAAIPVLAEALEAPDPAIQFRAVASLKEVSGRDLGNDVNAWREWAVDPSAYREEWSVAEVWRQIF
jgi:hypothetical protein